MKNRPRFLFWFIILLSVVAIFINVPKDLKISFQTPHLPILNKKISINKDLSFIAHGVRIGDLRIQNTLDFRKGLDLAGGTSITLRADMKDIPKDQQDSALESAKTVIERRIDLFGVSEPILQTSQVNNDYRIIVELPGVTDVSQAVNLIGSTAELSFWEDASGSAKEASPNVPSGLESFFQVPHKTSLTGGDLERASVGFDATTAQPEVALEFTVEGAKKFEDITRDNINKPLAIILDNQVVQAPRVNQVISGGNARITGMTLEQAKALSIQLNAGALPVPLSVLEQHTIAATLGSESLQKSLLAAVIGLAVIVVFMCLLYGKLGVVASFALLLYTLFVLGIFKLSTLTPYGVTLSLAGIAGFVLSVGMAVDANILIFERMKEELRRGKPKEAALELGFSRAWSSIRDSNVSSIITSLILIQFGSGIVRGFAVTLLIGVLISMFSAIIVTRTFLRIAYR